MTNIVRYDGNSSGGVPEKGQVSRINTTEDLRAGQYWRAKDEIPPLTESVKRKRGIYLENDHPDYIPGGFGEQNRIGEEEYHVDVVKRTGCPEGRMYLVNSIKLVDGEMHAVELLGHPGEKESNRIFLVDEFLRYFEHVQSDEAACIREQEIAQIHQGIADLQHKMMQGPPPEESEPVAFLGHQPKLPPKPGVAMMVANINQIERLHEGAERALAMAQRQGEWIKEHTRLISSKTEELVPFYKERAGAALAATEEVMRYASDLQKGVQSLGLYSGTGVEVRTLATGKSADRNEPLVLYRHMLFMDEEYVIHVDRDGDEAGADHQDFDDFVEAMLNDEKLKDRILPFPRMVVLMRYRRGNKGYFNTETLEGAIANEIYNQPNRLQFLLVRDGENYYQVWSEFTTQAVDKLYPSKDMADKPFRGLRGEDITINDLHFSKAKDSFDDLVRTYKNLLILLWGLNDRENMFGDFYDHSDWTGAGFTDENFQRKYFKFWDPYEENQMIGNGLPSFDKWIAEKNSWLRSGSRVVANYSLFAYHENLKKNDFHKKQPNALSSVEGKAYEFIAKKTKEGLVVTVEAGRHIYPPGSKPSYYKTISKEIPLPGKGYDEHGNLRWLCLDMVEVEEIDHYLDSRQNRPYYMEYYGLFKYVRQILKQQDQEEAYIIDKLVGALEQGKVAVPDNMTGRQLAKQAIRLWRANSQGRKIPGKHDHDHAAAYKTILNNMWVLAGNNHPIKEAEDLAVSEGRKPLRLVMNGKNKFVLYATSVGDELEETLFDHVWVTRLTCHQRGGKLVSTTKKIMIMPKAVADEEILHEWDDLKDWISKDIPKIFNDFGYYHKHLPKYDYDNIRKTIASVHDGDISHFLEIGDEIEEWLETSREERRNVKPTSKYVQEIRYVQPFAIIRTSGINRIPVEGFVSRYKEEKVVGGFRVLAMGDDPFAMAYRSARNDQERQMAVKAYAAPYNKKDGRDEELARMAQKQLKIYTCHVPEWSLMSDNPFKRNCYMNSMVLDENWAESFQNFDFQRNSGKVSRLDEMLVWINPESTRLLTEISRKYGYDPVPFSPKDPYRI